MPSYYATQAYDCRPAVIWNILTDFPSWPRWFPDMASLQYENSVEQGPGAQLLALDTSQRWARWRVAEWREPELLRCHFEGTNAPLAAQVNAASLQFGLFDEPEGCTLEVEIAAEGAGVIGDFFVGTTLGLSARRILPRLIDAFTDHVIDQVSGQG